MSGGKTLSPVLTLTGVSLRVIHDFGLNAKIDMTTESMSPAGCAEYMMAHAAAVEADSTRDAIYNQLVSPALISLMRQLPQVEKNTLSKLMSETLVADDSLLDGLRAMRDPMAVAYAQQLIDAHYKRFCAERKMAIVARDEHYDAVIRQSDQSFENIRQQRAREAKDGIDDIALDYPAENDHQLKAHMRAAATEDLARFDRSFLPLFNGDMLQPIHTLMTATAIMAGKEMTLRRTMAASSPSAVFAPAALRQNGR